MIVTQVCSSDSPSNSTTVSRELRTTRTELVGFDQHEKDDNNKRTDTDAVAEPTECAVVYLFLCKARFIVHCFFMFTYDMVDHPNSWLHNIFC